MAAVQCGSLRCQKDSYAKRLTSRVVTCAPGRRRPDGKECYEVVLQDTVIFPEGGGQVRGRLEEGGREHALCRGSTFVFEERRLGMEWDLMLFSCIPVPNSVCVVRIPYHLLHDVLLYGVKVAPPPPPPPPA